MPVCIKRRLKQLAPDDFEFTAQRELSYTGRNDVKCKKREQEAYKQNLYMFNQITKRKT